MHINFVPLSLLMFFTLYRPQQDGMYAIYSRPNDYFGLALFACLCCFCPLGLVALFYSADVSSVNVSAITAHWNLYTQNPLKSIETDYHFCDFIEPVSPCLKIPTVLVHVVVCKR